MKFPLFCALVLASCTKPNPAVCCLDDADCGEVGLDEVRSCSSGLACVDHQCEVPSCSTAGCMASAPVCNITTDVCDPCTDSIECSRFPDMPVCDSSSGGCVECVGASDCSGMTPVCDANACRGCRLDSECPSGACGDDGACVAESAIVYMDAAGVDNGTCTKTSPCRTFPFAISKTSATRSHLVMVTGAYVHEQTQISSEDTSADPLYIHGSGSSLRLPYGDGTLLTVGLSSVIRDLDISEEAVPALAVGPGSIVVERVKIHGASSGIRTSGDVTVRDSLIEDASTGIAVYDGQVLVERTTIHGGTTAVAAVNYSTTVNLSNVLIYGTSDRALDLQNAGGGSIAFSTIADSGMTSGSGPQAVLCNSSMSIKSSVIWTSNSTGRVPVDGCGLSSTIVGPTGVTGAMNADPMFVDPANHDYHIKSTSPAKDAVDAGPPLDFEGDSRPRGTRFDIGADEAP